MTTLTHPLPAHGRPLFAAREVLQTIHRHVENGCPGAPYTHAQAIAMLCDTRAVHAAVIWAKTNGKNFTRQTIADILGKCVLFFDAPLTKLWEEHKPWSDPQWGMHPYNVGQYQECLDGSTPSDAYQMSAPNAQEVWGGWWKNMPLSTLDNVFVLSQNHLIQWCLSLTDVAPIVPACHRLAHSMKLPAHQHAAWARAEMWWSHHSEVATELIKAVGHNPSAWSFILAHTLGVSEEDIQALWGKDGQLVRSGLYNELHTEHTTWELPKKSTWNGVLNAWMTETWELLRTPLPGHSDLYWDDIVQHITEVPSTDLDVHDPDAQIVLAQRAPAGKILVVGKGHSGQHELVAQWCSGIDAIPYMLAPIPPERVHSTLNMASCLMLSEEKAVLMWDATHIKPTDLNNTAVKRWLNDTTSVPVVVCVSDTTGIQEEVLNTFHRIVWLDDMPLPARVKICEKFFPNPLALRVARSLKTRQEIFRAAQWCQWSQTFTWEHIRTNEQNFARAHNKASTLVQQSPVSVNMALSPMWQSLADRLCTAFNHPDRFASWGVPTPKGAILIGPPGTGKTLFARYLAHKLGVPCLTPNTVELARDPERIKQMFADARAHAPCVVLLDEAAKLMDTAIDPSPAALAMMAELDGVDPLEGVMLIATTNSSNIYSPIYRSGRLSEVHQVQLPLAEERHAIWQVFLRPEMFAENFDEVLDTMVHASRGFTGADIAEVVRQATTNSILENTATVSVRHLLSACDYVRWAPANGLDPVLPDERRRLAIHEAGHALLAWRWRLDVLRVTVRARGYAFGSVQWMHPERQYGMTRQDLHGLVQMTLGGLAAEQSVLGEYGNGGAGDLMMAEALLNNGISTKGFGQDGPVGFGNPNFWSDRRRQQVEQECSQWSRNAFEEATQWLKNNADLLQRFSEVLLEKIDMSGPELLVFQKEAEHCAQPLPKAPVFPALNPPTLSLSGPSESVPKPPPQHILHHSGAQGQSKEQN